ncbi:YceI family protein [Marinibactrum halimedae]|uniref:Lipid/polyisoprenoid-binding YceI-like domain-containing protein n=1 Tax=Marinibactrum halimedae TaxID=1444977 RepID=A0AA37T4J1_9GAMM|nr:YceI family protein [Marinibactrum halimedae]MCD9457419.1 YceI family protein [Marinibactrum halimedae]GLS25531.1 hypothetical protein GCM10007877_12450 [Marinibactrum halimedae]
MQKKRASTICSGIILLSALLSNLAWADWALVSNQSALTFVSTKAGNIAEVHKFSSIKGQVTAKGAAIIEIDLISIDSAIPIRDERMQKFLFETAKFPKAKIVADVSGVLKKSKSAAYVTASVPAQLQLHGQEQSITLELAVATLNDGQIMVSATQPTIVNASGFDLVAGIEKLREIAGLPAISHSVPVSFSLLFAPSPTKAH